MQILFIQPGLHEVNNEYPPIGICYLASVARNHGHIVDIYDAASADCSLEHALEFAIHFHPDVLCISLYTVGLIEQYQFIKSAKKAIPGCTVVVGGPHSTALPVFTLQECPEIDFLSIGEGEETIVELLAAIEEKIPTNSVKGICYRVDEKVVQNEPRNLIHDLDKIPFPAYDLLRKNGFKYSKRSFNLSDKVGAIMSSRGCPFHCTFCFKATFGSTFRRRSPENVVQEMQWQIDQFGVTEFQFLDDLFAVNSQWLDNFFQELDKKDVKVSWKCLSRVNSVKKDDLVKMHQHGCYGVEFGVESGNDEILAIARKGITTSQVRKAFRIAKDIGLLTFGFFIFGLEKDTHETIKQTCNFAVEISPDLCGFAVLLPFPGTRIYEQLPQNLRFNWALFNSYYDKKVLPFSVCDVSPNDLRKYAQQADALVSGSFSYLFQNVVFRNGGHLSHRREAFNKWFRSRKMLIARRIRGEFVFGDHAIVKNFLILLGDLIIISIVGIFLSLPLKILKQLKNSN